MNETKKLVDAQSCPLIGIKMAEDTTVIGEAHRVSS